MRNVNPEQLFGRSVVVCLGATLCCLLWGSAFPVVKIGYSLFQVDGADTAAQILFAGSRFTLAGCMVILIGSVSGRSFLKPRRDLMPRIIWLAMLQTVLQYIFFYIGLARTSGVKASVIEAMNVFVAILIAGFIFGQEKVTGRKILGCVIGFIGVVLVNLDGMNLSLTLTGEGFIFFSTVAYAFSSVFMKRYSAGENPVLLSGYQFLIGGLVMVAAGLAMGGRLGVTGPLALPVLAYLALLSAIAYTIWGLLLKYNPVSKVAVYGFMTPMFGVILSMLLLKEAGALGTGLVCLVAMVLVCAGIYIVNTGEKAVN